MSHLSTIQTVAAAQCIDAPNLDALRQAVRQCADTNTPIADYGDFHHGLGHAPPANHARIQQTGRIVEHYVSDLTIRAAAATPFTEISNALAAQNQWLPVDGIDPAMTLGEAVAHNAYGPLSAGFGAWRDLLLGLRYIDDAGDQITVGGRTVKNVAGYDVTKLMVGNLNTLGLITELTLRTYAVPKQITHITIQPLCPRTFDQHATALLTSDAAPISLDFQFPNAGRPTVHMGYAGSPRACDAHVDALKHWLTNIGRDTADIARHDGPLTDLTSRLTDQHQALANAAALVKLVVPAANFGATIHNIRNAGIPAHHVNAMPTQDVIYFAGDWDVDQAQHLDQSITAAVRQVGGFRVWHRRPDDTPTIPPCAPPQEDWALLAQIKNAMDPRQLFNPDRLSVTDPA